MPRTSRRRKTYNTHNNTWYYDPNTGEYYQENQSPVTTAWIAFILVTLSLIVPLALIVLFILFQVYTDSRTNTLVINLVSIYFPYQMFGTFSCLICGFIVYAVGYLNGRNQQ